MTPTFPWEVAVPIPSLAPIDKRYWSFFPATIDDSIFRGLAVTNLVPLASGTLYCTGNLIIPAGKLVTNLLVFTGNTVTAAITNNWLALIDEVTNNVLGLTADLLAAHAASVLVSIPLTTPYRAPKDQSVYVGMCQVGTTPNSFRGLSSLSGAVNLPPNLAGSSNAGLVGPGTLPSPITDPTGATVSIPWVGFN